MEISEKLVILGRYLALTKDQVWNIEVVDDEESILRYDGDDFKVLTEKEVDAAIEVLVDDEVYSTTKELESFDFSEAGLSYWYNLSISVDRKGIKEDFEESYPDYLGCGTVELFEDLYIFEL